MTYKRTPTDDEIETLAKQFRPLWRNGEAVRPWLRKHAVMLTNLVHDDWSWAGVATALDRAGIAYKTGNPWQAEQLRAKIAAARRPLKRDALCAAKQSDVDQPDIVQREVVTSPTANSEIPNPTVPFVNSAAEGEEPEFKFVKLANWSGNNSPPVQRVQVKAPVDQLPVQDVDALVAKLTGGKSS